MTGAIRGRTLVFIFVVAAMFSLSGCGSWNYLWGRDDRAKATPEILYQSGYEAYQDGYYKKAIEHFQRLRDQQPLKPCPSCRNGYC